MGRPFLDGKKQAFHVRVEVKIEELFIHSAERSEFSQTGICEDNVEGSTMFLDCLI